MSKAGAHGNSKGDRPPGKPEGPKGGNPRTSMTDERGSGARFPSSGKYNVVSAETMEPRHAKGSRTGGSGPAGWPDPK